MQLASKLLVMVAMAITIGVSTSDSIPGCTDGQPCAVEPDSHVVVSEDQVYEHPSVEIKSGAILECSSQFCEIELRATNLTIRGTVSASTMRLTAERVDIIGGHIHADGLGQSANTGPGAGTSATGSSGSGGGFGGAGSDGCAVPHPPGGQPYGDVLVPEVFLGSGGGDSLTDPRAFVASGGRGGGAVVITATTIFLTEAGKVSANGGDGGFAPFQPLVGGGGSGGFVLLTAENYLPDPSGGIIAARGGRVVSGTGEGSPNTGTGGGGGGGRVYIVSPDGSIPPTFTTDVTPGGSECGTGSYGTVTKWEGHRFCVQQGGSNTFECQCEEGYGGELCDRCEEGRFGENCAFSCPFCGHLGNCSHSLVGSGCTCFDGVEGARCDRCIAGRYGEACQHLCAYCGEHAFCDDGLLGDGTCRCAGNFAGDECDECDPLHYGDDCELECPACGAFGTCDSGRNGTGVCICDDHFVGDRCEECVPGRYSPDCSQACGDCGDHASCEDGVNGRGCVCDETWLRSTEGSDACDDCVPDHWGDACVPCNEGHCGDHGHCLDGVDGSGQCECDDGWWDFDCSQKCPVCSVHGTCDFGRDGSGRCVCDTGWAGDLCDECAPGFYGPSCTEECPGVCPGVNEVCESGFSGRGCVCAPNWAASVPGGDCDICNTGYYGPSCVECPPCSPFGTCNSDGLCECHDNHFGLYCNHTCPDCGDGLCDAGRTGSGRCECPDDNLQGEGCFECAHSYYGPACAFQCDDCGENAECDDGQDGVGCKCSGNFTRSGGPGTPCDECTALHWGASCQFACQDCGHGVCEDGIDGDGHCICHDGWAIGDDGRCSVCAEHYWGTACTGSCPTCSAGQVCDREEGVCRCVDGWSGPDCDVCPEAWEGSQCDRCAEGYFGDRCQRCKCSSEGSVSCDDGIEGDGSCECREGYIGEVCDECDAGYLAVDDGDDDGEASGGCVPCRCAAGAACDGTGKCECVSGADGAVCDLRSTDEYCRPPPPEFDGEGEQVGGFGGAEWEPEGGPCIAGVSALARGLNLVTGEAGQSPIFALGWRPGSSVDLGDQTVSVPAGVDVDALDDQLQASEMTLIGSSAEAQAHILHSRMGVAPPADSSFPSSSLAEHPSMETIVNDLANGRLRASLVFRVEVARMSIPALPLAARWGAEYRGTAPRLESAVSVTNRFRDDISALPATLDEEGAEDAYLAFVQRYGTHYVSSVSLGGRLEVSGRAAMCAPSFAALAGDADARTELEAALARASGPRVRSVDGIFAGLDTTSLFRGGDVAGTTGLDEWAASVPGNLDVVGYTIGNLQDVIDDPAVRNNVRTTVSKYFASASLPSVFVETFTEPENSTDPEGSCSIVDVGGGSSGSAAGHTVVGALVAVAVAMVSAVLGFM